MNESRELITLERILGSYEVAVAICSDGDVINFVDGEKQGIVLIDTLGHCKDVGDAMSEFLRQEIEQGWGVDGNAEEEFINLATKLASFRGELSRRESDEWYDSNSGIYVQFDCEEIGIVSTGGILEPLIRRQGIGRYEKFPINSLRKLDDEYLKSRTSMHRTDLRKDEIMVISSDGLRLNMAKSFSDDGVVHPIFSRYIWECTEFAIQNVLDKFSTQSATEIRDQLVNTLSPYFLPRDRGYDDVTFAIVKRH